ncbi:F-box only protein 36-like isoform X2 [Pomacea canaliculata]|uniref:F-box only protein 36-like isoform X2 n=1 Tax=Pomacea canaliculata TaxID=400727 RepID=UPI000D730279|nr:F-box only protein 36-like isoform X2 [Pomacea canaliculata]
MASYTPWLNENGALVETSGSAISPSKDFFHIFLSPTELIYRVWKILPPTRPDSHAPPVQIRDTWEEFKHDERLHSEIIRVSGEKTLRYLENIMNGHLDYLSRLPHKVLVKIIVMLPLEDICQLAMTNQFFRELCRSNEVWEKIYLIYNKQPLSQELLMLVELRGWREVFFTNKLQLQMQLRRLATKAKRKKTSQTPSLK